MKFSLLINIPVDCYEVVFMYGCSQLLQCVTYKIEFTALKTHFLQSIFSVTRGPVLTTLLLWEKPTFPLRICVLAQHWWEQLASISDRSCVGVSGHMHKLLAAAWEASQPDLLQQLSSPSLGSPASCCVTAMNLWFGKVTAALHLLRSSRFMSECWKLWRCYYSIHAFADGANLVQLPDCTKKMRTSSRLCLLKTCG